MKLQKTTRIFAAFCIAALLMNALAGCISIRAIRDLIEYLDEFDENSQKPASSVAPASQQDDLTTASAVRVPDSLADAIEMTDRYVVTIATTFDGETSEEVVYVSRDVSRFTFEDLFGNEYTDYTCVTEDDFLYYSDFVDVVYLIRESSGLLEEFDYRVYHGLTVLNADAFTESAPGVYEAAKEQVNDLAKALLYDDDDEETGAKEVFVSLTVTLKEDGIGRIEARSEYNDGEDDYEVRYLLTFSSLNEEIVLPSEFIEVTEENYSELFPDDEEEIVIEPDIAE